jgi:hypothetical protein
MQNTSDAQFLAFLQQMNTQDQQAIAAQQQAQQAALKAAQQATSQQAAQNAANLAQQEVQTAGQVQAIQDQPKQAAAQAAAQNAGQAVTGAPVNVGAMNTAALTNLGAASGQLPKTAANLAGNVVPPVNPAMPIGGSIASAANPVGSTNRFSMPAMNGLRFGGG